MFFCLQPIFSLKTFSLSIKLSYLYSFIVINVSFRLSSWFNAFSRALFSSVSRMFFFQIFSHQSRKRLLLKKMCLLSAIECSLKQQKLQNILACLSGQLVRTEMLSWSTLGYHSVKLTTVFPPSLRLLACRMSTCMLRAESLGLRQNQVVWLMLQIPSIILQCEPRSTLSFCFLTRISISHYLRRRIICLSTKTTLNIDYLSRKNTINKCHLGAVFQNHQLSCCNYSTIVPTSLCFGLKTGGKNRTQNSLFHNIKQIIFGLPRLQRPRQLTAFLSIVPYFLSKLVVLFRFVVFGRFYYKLFAEKLRKGLIRIAFELSEAGYQLSLVWRRLITSALLYIYWSTYILSFFQNLCFSEPVGCSFGLLQFVDDIAERLFGLFVLTGQRFGVVFAVDLAFGEVEMFEVVLGVGYMMLFAGGRGGDFVE